MRKLLGLLLIALIGLSGCCCPCAKKMHDAQPTGQNPAETQPQEQPAQ